MAIYHRYQFESLELKEKIVLSSLFGQFLISRRESNYRIKLYFLYYYYVEVYFSEEDEEILYVRTFISTRGLSPFLANIKLTGLPI